MYVVLRERKKLFYKNKVKLQMFKLY